MLSTPLCTSWLLLSILTICGCREREEPPRFARPGTFEFEYSKRWKSLDDMEKQQRQQVEKNIREAREKLEGEMDDAFHVHQANMIRQGKFSLGQMTTFQNRKAVSSVLHVCSCTLFRSAEAGGGTTAHGRDAQCGDAEEERDAAQVLKLV